MFFIYHRKSRPTGKTIAEALGLPHGRELPPGPTWVLRWGSQRGMGARDRQINTAAAIGQASDKLRAFQAMQAAGNVPIPEFRTTPPDRFSGTWFGRTRRGARGIGIIVQPEGLITYGFAESELFTRFIPNDREYRLHVVGDQVVRVQRKYLDHPEQQTDPYIKNHANGYRFKAPQLRLKPDREEAAVAAVQALDLDFGAVDMVVDHDDKAWVLEVNTAPACSPLTATAYVGALASMIEERTGDPVYPNYDALNILTGEDTEVAA